MSAISTIPVTSGASCTGLEEVFRDHVWRIARVCCPKLILKYHPSVSDLEDADYFAGQRSLWIVERKSVWVATLLRNDDESDTIYWREPELVEIAACQQAWQLLPLWLQTPIWRRLLDMIRGYEPLAHDRPEIRRLAEATFRARVDRAIQQGNHRLLEELVTDCPFWRIKGRAELLQQEPCELRQWHRLLRFPKGEESRSPNADFTRALRHAAGFLDATTDFEE